MLDIDLLSYSSLKFISDHKLHVVLIMISLYLHDINLNINKLR